MEWTHINIKPKDGCLPLPATSYEAAHPVRQPGAFRSFTRRFFSPRWTVNAPDSSAHGVPARPWGTGRWSAPHGEVHITTEHKSSNRRRSSGSDQEAIKCLVVDNDFAPFISDKVELDELDRELASELEKEEARTFGIPHSHDAHHAFGSDDCKRFLVGRLWPFMRSFVHMSFEDKQEERAFQQERWQTNKLPACAGASFLLLSTLLSIGFVVRWTTWNYYAYIGIAGFFTFALPFLILFNTYLKAPWVYQVWLLGATWCWPFILAIEINNCGFFDNVNTCGGRQFLNFFALLAGVPTFALITLLQNRLLHLLGITAWGMAMVGMFIHQPKANLPMWRNVILASVYHHILVWAAYFRERSDRQLFTLRSQLKAQFRAVQSAQEMERRAQDSKKRFVAYIFHEVRVPLNTARLALSNLDAEGAFSTLPQDQRELLVGLDVSLRTMGKVLNDVLSFNRMESGNLVLTRNPFNLHEALQSISLAHRATAEATGLSLSLDLDPGVDAIGGVFVGDEMRFKQVCSNLVSNAFKFTQSGGVKIATRLLHPVHPPATPDRAVVRFEVHDSGVGLSLSDVRFNRLFSPFVQTELGRRQGGKGSGLGLALVMQIVKLSHGRLGVDSEPGGGSVFWFELPFTIPPPEAIEKEERFVSSAPPMRGGLGIVWQPTHTPSESQTTERAILQPCSPPIPNASMFSAPPVTPSTPFSTSPASSHPVASPRITELVRGTVLPASPQVSTSETTLATPQSVPDPPLSALVVDDDPLTRRLMTRMLTRLGHTVQTASDGQAALDILTHSWAGGPTIDVVFLDNQMPTMSGVEAVRAVRALPCDVYVVGCTGNALKEDQEEYLNAGADAIVPKPISLTAIKEQLGHARARCMQGMGLTPVL